jgi:hypothetical protein
MFRQYHESTIVWRNLPTYHCYQYFVLSFLTKRAWQSGSKHITGSVHLKCWSSVNVKNSFVRKLMMIIAFITFNSGWLPLIEGLCSWNPWEFEVSGFRRNRTDDRARGKRWGFSPGAAVCYSLSARAYTDCRKNDLFEYFFGRIEAVLTHSKKSVWAGSTRFSTKKIGLNMLNPDFWTTFGFSRLHQILKKVNSKINRLILTVGLTKS